MALKHTKEHPGFESVAESIARKMDVPEQRADRILAGRTRKLSAAAKRRNPRLKRVKG